MLPVSPTVPPPPAPLPPPGPRSWQLTLGWRVAFAVGWAGVFGGFIAAWSASRQIGLSTWWLGPRGDPQPVYVMMIPFLAPTAMVMGALNGARFLPWAGLGAAAITAAIGFGDVGRVNGLAIVELALAGAGAAISIAAYAGRYRA